MSQSNGDALNEIKNQTKQIFHNKIEKSLIIGTITELEFHLKTHQ